MAQVFQCDRCKNVIPVGTEYTTVTLSSNCTFKVELCQSCIKALDEFLANRPTEGK